MPKDIPVNFVNPPTIVCPKCGVEVEIGFSLKLFRSVSPPEDGGRSTSVMFGMDASPVTKHIQEDHPNFDPDGSNSTN